MLATSFASVDAAGVSISALITFVGTWPLKVLILATIHDTFPLPKERCASKALGLAIWGVSSRHFKLPGIKRTAPGKLQTRLNLYWAQCTSPLSSGLLPHKLAWNPTWGGFPRNLL